MPRKPISHLHLSSLSLLGALALAGCQPHTLDPVEVTHSSSGSSRVALELDRKVDILFVVDDSGSMGEEQAKLAANFAPFIATLEEAGADYRIAVTTTDDGAPGCGATAEGGRFVATSCLDRPEDFVRGGVDRFEEACAANCGLTTEQLGILPTVLEQGGPAVARPWIESLNGAGNLADGVSALEAFQCLAPQGISGCGFEAQLESMARGLRRAEREGEPEFGFLRPGANLMIVVVTDEADCSFDKDHEPALFHDGIFFEPGLGYATSASCWNAGVACTGPASGYEDCRAVDLDGSGAQTDQPGASVLHPVDGYVDQLAALAVADELERAVMVSVIAGVPQGYASGEAAIDYREPDDPEVADLFGIDYGCTSGGGPDLQFAIPPVRLKAFAESFAGAGPNLFSVCEDDYTPALQQIVDSLVAEFHPSCFDDCAVDVHASTPGVQPNCRIVESVPVAGGEVDERFLPECVVVGDAPTLPTDADACWIARGDADGSTPTTADDLDPACDVEGQNLEFGLLRRTGVSVVGGTTVEAECEVEAFPSVVCPG